MTREELREFLASRADIDFVERELLGRRPWIFQNDGHHHHWQRNVAASLQTSPANVLIVGSAATGYSLSPHKPGRPFRRLEHPQGASDIDVAVIDPLLFVQAWETIVAFDRTNGLEQSRKDKTRLDVYWGLVASQNIPNNTSPARIV